MQKRTANGMVAAGAPATCLAGHEVLEMGGNAVDAAVAATAAAFVAEPPLTSGGGGGLMMIHQVVSGETTVCDFVPASGGLGLPPANLETLDFQELTVSFGSASQRFFVGRGTAGVPGGLIGLLTAQRKYGHLPAEQVFAPAVRMAKNGVILTPAVAGIVRILEKILGLTPACHGLFFKEGRLLQAGDLFRNEALGHTLEEAAKAGPDRLYDGILGERLLAQFGPPFGRITRKDLETYRPEFRQPLEIHYRGHTIYTVPPPAAGGTWVDFGLKLLEGLPLSDWAPFGPDRMAAVCGALTLAAHCRPPGALRPEYPGGNDWRDLRQHLADYLQDPGRTKARLAAAARPAINLGSTTHVSVIDREGNAVSVTTSAGETCGNVIEGTGVIMNNFMGEEDINPGGFYAIPAGERVPTMMAPCLMRSPDGSWTSLGTGGSTRIRSAMIQMLSNLVDHRMDPKAAVEGPRIHLDDTGIYLEEIDPAEKMEEFLRHKFPELVIFRGRNFYFGGVHLVKRDAATGILTGTGDSRRGGMSSDQDLSTAG